MVKRLLCKIGKHDYGVLKEFSPTARMVGCMRCKKIWAMNDDEKAFIPWDAEFEELYFGDKPWSLGFTRRREGN